MAAYERRKGSGMDIFGQTFVATANTDRTTTVFVSFVGQTIMVIAGILMPMIYFNALPGAQLKSLLVAPPPPSPPPPSQPASKVVKIIPRQFDAGGVMAPRVIPKFVALIQESELPPASAVGDGVGIANPAVLRDTLGPASTPAPPPPLPIAKTATAPPAHVRIGGIVQSAKLVRQPKPVYPEVAIKARIQGVVKLHALISKEGIIEDLRVINGHPLLVPAALEAVKQWVYRPTLLNGEPVGVETDIDVNFTLQ